MNRGRFSRGLVFLCLITLVLGATVYVIHNRHEKQALARSGSKSAPPMMATDSPAAKTTIASSTTQPTTAPSVNSNDARLAADKVAEKSDSSPNHAPVIAAAWSPTPTALPDAPPANFIATAAAKQTAGDLLGARKILNDALLSGKLNAFDTEATKKSITDVNAQLIFSPNRYPDDEYGGTHIVKPGESLQKIAASYDVPWQFLASINNLTDPRKMKSGAKLKIIKGPFAVVVTKSKFNMDLWLGSTPGQPGSMFVRSYPVGLGREDSTPTGTWMVGVKAKDPQYYSPRGEGVFAPDDPKNPLGHRWISLNGLDGKALGAQSYGIHGTIEPDSIGKMASMGCIRMHNEDVAVVFDMLAEGKSIVVVQN